MFTITIFMKKAILFLSVVIVSNVYAQTYLSGDIIITNPSKVSGSLNYDFPSGTTGSFSYDGKEYSVKVSTDGNKYLYYTSVDSTIPLGILGGNVYLGIDMSETAVKFPFQGYIGLAPFTYSSNNVKITQWFETFPVGAENTFSVESELDIGLVSTSFFTKFAEFVKRYVYPTLASFKAKMALKCKITYLPYVRQKVTYVASNADDTYESFMVEEETSEEHIPYEVENEEGSHEDFFVQQSDSN